MVLPAQRAVAFAPASIGNVAVGFDVLGLAIAGVGDFVSAERTEEPGLVIETISAEPYAASALALTTVADKNTAGIAALELIADLEPDFGVRMRLHKGIPLGSGMGSSAASAVAAAVAVNAVMPDPLAPTALLGYAMAGEAFASGAYHADNVAPSLFGGLVACPAGNLPTTQTIALPPGVVSVLVLPELRVDTAASRVGLAADVPLSTVVRQTGFLTQFLCACANADTAALKGAVRDVMIEPQREGAVAGFALVRDAALAAGAFGVSLSGSGPSVFALCEAPRAQAVCSAMVNAFDTAGIAARGWVSPGDSPGARLITSADIPESLA